MTSLQNESGSCLVTHSAGPWSLSDVREFGAPKIEAWTTESNGHRWRKRICTLHDNNMDEGEPEANAALIAAAPELLAIAKRIAEHFAYTDAPLGVAAREAIAKAEAR